MTGCSVDDIDAPTVIGVGPERYPDFPEPDARGIHRGMGPDIAWFTAPAGNVLSVVSDPVWAPLRAPGRPSCDGAPGGGGG